MCECAVDSAGLSGRHLEYTRGGNSVSLATLLRGVMGRGLSVDRPALFESLVLVFLYGHDERLTLYQCRLRISLGNASPQPRGGNRVYLVSGRLVDRIPDQRPQSPLAAGACVVNTPKRDTAGN